MAEVVLENVVKIYPGNIRAVDNVSLAIRDEEFIVLVGPSGCGKSTTLRMVAGLEEISDGTIRIGERVVNSVAPKDRDIAMVFQNYALYPHMSVYKNMAFGLKLRRVPKAEIDERVRGAARMLGIEHLLDRKPKALSGGQRQRVAVGRAIVRTPKAFLFDEPLSNLDAKLRIEMRAELKKLHRKLRTTTIYVTHDQEEAMTLGDRIVVMKDGVIHQCGSPLEVYERPVNRFVAGFVGTPPMNFLKGRVEGESGGLWFDEGSGRLRLPDRLARAMAGCSGREMILGVRPEGMGLRSEGRFAGRENVLSVAVTVVEPLGDRMDVHVQTGRHDRIVCRVDADRMIRDGMRLPMYLDMEQVHVFEPGDEGVNVSLTGSGDHASAA
ncbi:MAG TPA: sn-glycerol-3-phosphate ABC transporter ATP-binding protein UgpC [Phycisphaerae bacterium]|nr:sn-glycerol-3-phosphate ABC transporter ATP-binding protein UgpC [Phycisphaerae bacterium]HRY69289.1 sn-glycerol-3-phosphate ABC transporter ATP-binding protein UgpC [Phycisphaerae bacterium]HSA26607.1 sn-glycerol-3-phosphate ABC transporter ATP-binding protein UgpC [Phycisphaerae bacterium]